MLLLLPYAEVKPHQAVRILEEEYGHRLTTSVIRKWDNMILSKTGHRERKNSEARFYDTKDILTFNAIAVLRSLGYSIEDTRRIIEDLLAGKGNKAVIPQLKSYVEKQIKGLDQLEAFMKSGFKK